MIKCANCGVVNDPDATFCKSCHHFLAWEESDTRGPAAAENAAPPTPPVELPRPEPAEAVTAVEAVEDEDEAEAVADDVEVEPEETVGPAEVDELPAEPPAAAVPELREVLDTVTAGQQLARESGREDLAEHLEQARVTVAERLVSVAVVGEFKRGKSTLVNAILQTAVCPVDADIVTAVPTAVRYGAQTAASAFFEPAGEDTEPEVEDVPLDALATYVSEAGNPGNRRRLRVVEVVLPRPILRAGLCLIDTPGVGGLDSAHGLITLSAMSEADGVLFVTDASQELTAPEIEFLRSAVERCPNAVCVMTKADLYMEWRRIAELDEQHLRDAGLDVPVVPVSSFLRLAATDDQDMLVESGFPALVDFLLGKVVAAATARKVATAEREVDFIATQLEDGLRAEQEVLQKPAEADKVVERLDGVTRKSHQLNSPTATWQQMLTDGIQDLVAHTEFDLQERLRTVMRDVETIIDEGDPKQTWPDIEVWLRRQVVGAAVSNFDRMQVEARELAENVAQAFDLAAGEVSSAASVDVDDALANIRIASASSLENPGGRMASMLLAGRTATLVPMVLVGALGHIMMPVIAPVALVLAAGIGQKVIRDERRRQTAYRRQQAKNAARKYVDEVAFMVAKDSRDALRVTQRALRDDFQSRANTLLRSAEAALSAARSTAALDPDARAARADEVARDAAKVVDLRSRRTQHTGSLAVVNG
ncbi:MAG TPA: dynamin family protein [Jatrophihabitans sp.]|nr:dynamin family protein [Jatrophihabitans sp.]